MTASPRGVRGSGPDAGTWTVVAASEYPRLFWLFATGALIVGGGAVAGLGYGCVQVVRETGLAVQSLTEEAGFALKQQ